MRGKAGPRACGVREGARGRSGSVSGAESQRPPSEMVALELPQSWDPSRGKGGGWGSRVLRKKTAYFDAARRELSNGVSIIPYAPRGAPFTHFRPRAATPDSSSTALGLAGLAVARANKVDVEESHYLFTRNQA